MIVDLPPKFVGQMRRLLGAEAEAFLAVYGETPRQGLRANTLKISAADLEQRLPYHLEPVAWAPEGFVLGETPTANPPPGKHPDHAAGLYYLQEPAAMAAARLLAPQPGERVLDLSAAPGGKATHLAALLQGQGWLLANEIHPGRVWELAENLERCGVRNATITQETPQRLAGRLSGVFDRILVDAPCSGEGMFRKSEAAWRDWSPEAVQSCALRQAGILDAAVRMLRPGGRLVYSTCTFNPTENEAVVADLLGRYGDLALVEVPPQPGFAPGRPDWLAEDRSMAPNPEMLRRAVRLWPHHSPAEGHFIALLEKTGANGAGDQAAGEPAAYPARKGRARDRAVVFRSETVGQKVAAVFDAFRRDHLGQNPLEGLPARLSAVGARLYAIPEAAADVSGLKVIHPGWQLGSLPEDRRGEPRFEPAHALALGLPTLEKARRLDFAPTAPELRAYLRGETLPSDGENGWVVVCVNGYALGWGKRSQGTLKNSYPRGLRWM